MRGIRLTTIPVPSFVSPQTRYHFLQTAFCTPLVSNLSQHCDEVPCKFIGLGMARFSPEMTEDIHYDMFDYNIFSGELRFSR